MQMKQLQKIKNQKISYFFEKKYGKKL